MLRTDPGRGPDGNLIYWQGMAKSPAVETQVEPVAVDPRDAVDDSGVDLTLIRAYLQLTPLERLRALQNNVRALQKFRPLGPPDGR